MTGVPIDLDEDRDAGLYPGRAARIISRPPQSVWKLTTVLSGPKRFVLAGSGHIAGVVNPPAAGKYQYWTNDEPASTLDEFVAGATEHKGSWWPDWIEWLKGLGAEDGQGRRRAGAGRGQAQGDRGCARSLCPDALT